MNKKILLDTNILVYAHFKNAPQQEKAQKIILSALKEKNGVIAYQNLLEFYNVVTDSRKITQPITPKQAKEIIDDYLKSELTIIYPNAESYINAIKLVAKLKLSGKQRIFDALLVSTMLQWKIKTIYTNDLAHFKGFPDIEIVNPF